MIDSQPRATGIAHSILDGQHLAAILAATYDLAEPVTCRLLKHGINDVYLVESGTARYVLRISPAHRYGPFDQDAYRFELELLTFLAAHQVAVVAPVPQRDGDLLGSVDSPEGVRYTTLFPYAAGSVVFPLDTAHAKLLGAAVARFHQVADQFVPALPRFSCDSEYLLAEPLRLLKTFGGLAEDDLAFLDRLCDSLAARLAGLSRDDGRFGILHGDVWWNNVHFVGSTATLFDFDYCGYGWRIADLAALGGNATLYGYQLPPEVTAAFLAGYESIRPLFPDERAALEDFEKITVIWALGVWASRLQFTGFQPLYERFGTIVARLRD